ncbi:hypothetical protein ACLB2K_059623 [Fragaria x ananassa]
MVAALQVVLVFYKDCCPRNLWRSFKVAVHFAVQHSFFPAVLQTDAADAKVVARQLESFSGDSMSVYEDVCLVLQEQPSYRVCYVNMNTNLVAHPSASAAYGIGLLQFQTF